MGPADPALGRGDVPRHQTTRRVEILASPAVNHGSTMRATKDIPRVGSTGVVATIALLLAVLGVTNVADAGDEDGNGFRNHLLHLNTRELFELFEHPDRSDDPEVKAFNDGVLDRIEHGGFGTRWLALLPSEKPTSDDAAAPPMFGLVAKVEGSTLVSLTRPGVTVDPDDRVFLQRTVVSNLWDHRQLALSVYEDHALDDDQLKFVGFGARVTARPDLNVFGWSLRMQLFGSFHPSHGGTAYLAITGSPSWLQTD
jgi:hypothetical protein